MVLPVQPVITYSLGVLASDACAHVMKLISEFVKEVNNDHVVLDVHVIGQSPIRQKPLQC